MQKVAVLALCAVAISSLGVPSPAHAADFVLGAVLPDGLQAGLCTALLLVGLLLLHRSRRKR